MEDEYRAYREVIAAGVGTLRPRAEVTTVRLDLLERELGRLDPEVVICSGPEPPESGVRLAWVELPLDPARPTKISLDGRRSESTNPTMEALLAVVDEAEKLSRS